MEMQLQDRYGEINLYDLWKVIIKRKKIVLWMLLIFVTLSSTISLLMPKIYRGEVVIIVPAFENPTLT